MSFITLATLLLALFAPAGFAQDGGAGAVRVSVENRGANGYSAPVVKTFELSEPR